MICYSNLDRAGICIRNGCCRGSWGSGCSLGASICSKDGRSSLGGGSGRSSWCSRGRDSWRKLPMIGIGWSMVLTI